MYARWYTLPFRSRCMPSTRPPQEVGTVKIADFGLAKSLRMGSTAPQGRGEGSNRGGDGSGKLGRCVGFMWGAPRFKGQGPGLKVVGCQGRYPLYHSVRAADIHMCVDLIP
jgi:hypothetical protein